MASEDCSLKDILVFLRSLSVQQHTVLSQVIHLVRLILVSPATNAISERSFSAMRRIKTYLRSTMSQCPLNSVVLLHIHKDKTDNLSVVDLANQFVDVTSNDHRRAALRTFTAADLADQ